MKRTLLIQDLLHKAPLLVCGVLLDATVEVVVSQEYRPAGYFGTDWTSEPEVDSIDIKQVYVKVDSYDDIMLLDQTSFKTRHKALYQAFEDALCVEALKQAKAAPEDDWSVDVDDMYSQDNARRDDV